MKNLGFILFLAFNFNASLFSYTGDNPELLVTHEIDAVTVFLNNAEISRTSTTLIPEGKTDLIFKGISKRMMDQGIKLFISNDVKVFAVNKETNKDALDESIAFQELEKERTDFINLKRSIESKESILEKELLYFESNMKIERSSNVTFEQIDEGAEYFKNKITDIERRLNEVGAELAAHIEKENKFFTRYRLQKSKISLSNVMIRITVESKSAVEAKIALKYLVTNALWKPYYSIRAKEEEQSVLIEYQAQLYNDTGNDWDNKPISLAILDSSDDVTKPELKTWNIEQSGDEKYQRNNKRRSNTRRSGSPIHDMKEKEEETDFLEIDNLSTRFVIQDLHEIPSDATPHLIDVVSYKKDVEFYNLSIPKIKNGAFLIARIKDWESLGLIDGDINLYYNDTYQGISKLTTNEINDTLDLSMGKENNFIVSRKKVSSSSRKRLIGFNITEIMTYEILIKNNKTEKSTIEIKDQIPISDNKDVEVKALNLSKGKLDPLTGQVTWGIKMEAGETKRLILKFSIKYPKSKKNAIKYKTTVISSPRYF